ncbi:MAG: DNA methyltransferase [Pseudonocardiaceae bacterium]
MNQGDAGLRGRLAEFVRYRREYLRGDEKGEAQIFSEALFRAFGHAGVRQAGATLEQRIKKRDAKGTAFADLMWKPRCLIEMKKTGVDLGRVYRQAFDYWIQAVPDRPRYVVLCNFDEFWVYDFDQQLDAPMDRLKIDDLPNRWEALAFLLPDPAAPIFGNNLVAVTRDAAAKVARVFTGLHNRGIDRDHAQRFVLQSVMAMFAEDIRLLPGPFFTRALEDSSTSAQAYDLLFGLFREMNTSGTTSGGRYKGTPYFNGGIFDTIAPFDVTGIELDALREAATTNWSAVRPEIFGTLFEQSMDAGERHAHGAHYTSQADIARIVIPTIVTPWQERLAAAGSISEIEKLLAAMYSFRVLDPACGSGNFLYVAYREMRRLEHEALAMIADRRRSADIAAQRALAYVTPDHFAGIDRNPFAVEVAKVTMMLAKKLAADELDDDQQVLPLDNLDHVITAGDALFMPWPTADAIIGNPPYLGRRKMIDELGAAYNDRLQQRYPHVGGVSDFVCYWFPLAHDHLPDGGRAGLVATKTIRETSSRKASLDYVTDHGGIITDAVSSQPWSGDAAVTVSIVNWIKNGDPGQRVLWLNNTDLRLEVDHIPSSLMPGIDVRRAVALPANQQPKVCFQGQTPGVTKGFTLDAASREALIRRDPRSARYIHPFLGGEELLHDLTIDRWIIDLPHLDALAAERDAPTLMEHLRREVLPTREKAAQKEAEQNADRRAANPTARQDLARTKFLDTWWLHWRRRADMLAAIEPLERYIALTIVASWERPSVYSFVNSSTHPAASLQVFAFDDNYSFGILTSSLHRLWFEARCSRLETRLRYTPTTVFDSFPWPQAPTTAQINDIKKIVDKLLQVRAENLDAGMSLARQYDTLRQPGKSRLRTLHADLDAAVLIAYGFSPDDDLLTQLLALNLDIAAEPEHARGPGRT